MQRFITVLFTLLVMSLPAFAQYCPLSGCAFTGVVQHGTNNLSGSNFTITGGTIDSTLIGSTTRAAVNATTLYSSALFTAGGTPISIATNQNIQLGGSVAGGADVSITTANNSNIVLVPGGSALVKTAATMRMGKISVRPDLSGGTTWSGSTSAEGVSNVFAVGGVTGTSASGDASFNYFSVPSDSVDCHLSGGGLCTGLEMAHNFGGTSMKGSRTVIGGLGNLTTTSGNTTGGGGSYVGGQFTIQAQVNDNGTTGTGNGKGLLYGLNPVAALTSSAATYYKQLTGIEVNVYAVAGSSVEDKIGFQVVQTSSDASAGSHDDVAISINNQNGAKGWTYGLEFGRLGGAMPVISTGTLIFGSNSGTGFNVANGIDFHLGVFSGNSWNDGHVIIAGSGSVNLNALSGLAVSATNGFVALPFTQGTPTGSPTMNTACAIDTTNSYLNCYWSNTWHKIQFTTGAG